MLSTADRDLRNKARRQVQIYVEKYLRILGASGETLPSLRVQDNIASRWLGITHWVASAPKTTTITIQQSVLGDAKTLERIVAHEVVHHVELVTMTPAEIANQRLLGKRYRISHGKRFRQLAGIVNKAVGDPSFVTEASDQSYAVATQRKQPYYLLITAPGRYGPHYGFAWAVRPSKDALDWAKEKGKIVMTTDAMWTVGAKMKRFGGVSLAKPGSEYEQRLRLMYEGA